MSSRYVRIKESPVASIGLKPGRQELDIILLADTANAAQEIAKSLLAAANAGNPNRVREGEHRIKYDHQGPPGPRNHTLKFVAISLPDIEQAAALIVDALADNIYERPPFPPSEKARIKKELGVDGIAVTSSLPRR